MRILVLIVLFGPFMVPRLSGQKNVHEVLQDSLSFQEELLRLEQYSSEYASASYDRCVELLNENTRRYPVLHIEMLRQLVSTGILSKRGDELGEALVKQAASSTSPIEKSAIQLLDGIVKSAFHKADLSELMAKVDYCDSLPSQPYHYDLVRRSFFRAYTRALEHERLYDEASAMAHSSLLLNLPKPYAQSAYYDEYLMGRHAIHGRDFVSAEVKFKKVIELIQDPATLPARNIRARAIHYLGIVAEKKGDANNYFNYTKQAGDSMLALNTIDAIPPLLDVVEYFIAENRLAEADVYLAKIDSVQKKYPSSDYIDGAVFFTKYKYAKYKGDLDDALRFALAAEKKTQQTILMEPIIESIIELLVLRGDYERAFQYQTHYIDVLTNKRDVNALREIESRRNAYELHKKENEREALLLQQKQQEKVISMQDLMLIAAIAAIFILLITAFYIAFVSKKLREANKLLERQAVELREAKTEAEKAAQAKSDFLSVMSHEIRTPLNAIIGLNNELIQRDPRPDQKDNLAYVDRSSQQLLELINDILDHTKLEAQKVILESKPVVLSELMNHLVKTTRFLCKKKPVVVKSVLDTNLPNHMLTDPLRLQQICMNLCTNAVKFTNAGEIELSFTQTKENNVVFKVADSGIGIAQDALGKIFDDFTQATSDTTRLYGGTGLGLSISKRLAELLGGTIDVESTEGKGSVFSVSIPLKTNDVKTIELNDEFDYPEDATILIAEDNELNKLVISSVLSRWKVPFVVVSNGEQAVEEVQKGTYALVLMDVQMPVMDGLEATRRIRALEDQKLATIPIVALTASSQPEEIMQMKDAGMNHNILKPIDTDVLKKVILELLTK